MRGLSRLVGLSAAAATEAASGVPVAELQALRLTGMEAYRLVEQLPRGSARLAAWNAYVLETYGDKLIDASPSERYVNADSAHIASQAFALAGWWLQQASELASNAQAPAADRLRDPLPHFHTPLRSREQLVALRTTLDALRAFVAYDLERLPLDDTARARHRAQLAVVDDYIGRASMLWIEHPPAEMRQGIGDALTNALDEVYALGQSLAREAGVKPASSGSGT